MGVFDIFKKDKLKSNIEANSHEEFKEQSEKKLDAPKKSSKRKSLVKEFEEYVRDEDDEAIKETFKKCDINAYGGVYKTNALGFMVSENVIKWLVESGADIEFEDTYHYRPLHHHAGSYTGHPEVLISLGADIHAKDAKGRTPLFHAVDRFNKKNVNTLIQAGADINEVDLNRMTPLLYALSVARNADIKRLVEVVKILLNEGAVKMGLESEQVKRIGTDFERFREAMSQEVINELAPALDELYRIFDVEPVSKRKKHDGYSIIEVTSKRWQEQYNELWEQLVPASGTADTIQGEAIRICGAISYEILDNGGINWCDRHENMCKDLLDLLRYQDALTFDNQNEIDDIVSKLIKRNESEQEVDRLTELVTKWVTNNRTPIRL